VSEYGDFTVGASRFGGHVTGKLHTMRKPQQFSVRPASDGTLYVQSDKSTGKFDFRTGKGVLNTKGTYFAHLSKALGAMDFEFPADFVKACLAACPALGSETDTGLGLVIVNTVEVI
jgi:hypothetical protein